MKTNMLPHLEKKSEYPSNRGKIETELRPLSQLSQRSGGCDTGSPTMTHKAESTQGTGGTGTLPLL